MTAEELAIIAQLVGGGKTLSDFQAQPTPAAPAAPSPYATQAAKYNTEADTLDKQAATPYPQPQGAKEQTVSALRAAMENFGRLGAPGGYYGQEEQRQKSFIDTNDKRVAQAKALRGEAAQQQQLGQQKDFQTGELANQAGNLAVSQKEQALREKVASQPIRAEQPTGSSSQAVDRNTQMPIPGTELKGPDRPEPSNKLPTKVIDEGGGKYGLWSYDSVGGTLVNRVGNAPAPGSANGGAGGFQMAPYTNDQGQAAIAGYNKKDNTITPATMKGDNTKAPVQTAAVGNQNAVQSGKEQAAFKDASASYQALVGLRDKSGSDPQSAYINDQGMVDQFFNIVKPTSGARMNGAYIAQLLHPGPLKNKAEVMYQKLTSGAPLTQEDRVWMVEAAKVVLDAKGSVIGQGAAPAPAAGGGFIKPGGALESLLKGGK